MDQPHKVYISLGSNKGDRLKHLQDAVDLIFARIGKVNIISKVYNTPALGFEGDDFLNTCIFIETNFSSEQLIDELLAIETILGRTRENTKGYQSRIIDLDVLFFDDEIINSKSLKVPHPKM